jgi:hypothetical protein
VAQKPSEQDGVALTATELTHRLVSRAAPAINDPAGRALATHAACERAYRELSRSIGQGGAAELLGRAIVLTQAQHPVLKDIRIGRQSTPDLEGVTIAIRTFGAPAVTAALEAALESLLGLLGRLVGQDLVSQLVESPMPNRTQDNGKGPQ